MIDRSPIEARDEMLQIPALVFCEKTHAGAETASTLGILAEELEDTEVGSVGKTKGRLVLLARVAILCEGIKDPRRSGAKLCNLEADSVEKNPGLATYIA